MAEDITFVHFRYGTYAEINNSANNRTLNPHAVYIATDKQLMYAKGAWIGVTSVTSEVNQDTGEITLKFNYDSEGQPTGNPITCPIKGAGMTTEQKAQLETAYKFAIDIGGTSADDIINKWQEVVDFLAGIEGGTLEGIVATKADKNTTIIAGDGLTGGGDLSENRTIKVESADDGITVNSDNIQLNTVDNLTTSSKTKPLSANQGKVLDGKVKTIADLLNDMFEKVTDNGKTYIKTKYGFASEQFVSAGGTDDTESGGSGGANLTQMWESLQTNNDTFKDRLINVAHIPTLTTGKISDFVSATQAIADTAVANKADKATTLAGYGITDAVKLINNSADDVRNTSAGFAHISQGTKWGGGLWTVFSSDKTAGIQINANAWANKTLATRIYSNSTGTWLDWHEVAFTDDVLPLTGGTLTGALTVNAPINNTGALKLLGASEVSSTGMAVGTGAKALGSNSRSLSEYSHAGLRTGNSNYPSAIISPYDLLPFTVNGETVYGTPIKANSSLTYKYNGISYTVENTTNYTQVLVLISVGSDFVAGVTHPLNKCALTYSKGYSLGSGQKIHAISELSDTVRAITIYTWVTGSTGETNFINNFVISNSNKLYTYKGVSLSTQSGNYSVASGASSVASGTNSVASGANSVASGSYSVASHESSKVFATRGISGRAHQTVLGHYNAEDTTSALVVGWGQGETNRKNVFTVDTYGYVRMGNRLHIGVGGQNEMYLVSETKDQLYVHTAAGIPFLIHDNFVRRGIDTPNATLGTDQYKWFNVFTESLKIADANLTYGIGTLTVDKALKTTSTLTATQGEFANYIKIGNATISWNPKGYLEINEGLASHKFISAGGVVTGNAGGGSGGLNLTDMWVSLSGNIDAYGKSKIHIDHIPLDVILSHDDYENDVADRINTFNYSNSSSFTSAVKALIVADNIPTLEMSKINGLEDTLTDIGTVVQSNYETLNTLITNNHNDHEARIKAIEQALTWQTV